MTQMQQRRWFRTKKIVIEQDNDIIVSEKSLFGSQELRFRVFDLHPLCERYRNNAWGYLLSALGLLILIACQSYLCWWQGVFTPDAFVKVAVFTACMGVLLTLAAWHRISKYEFFHRNGKAIFSIWRRLGEDVEAEQFAHHLLRIIKVAHQDRFAKARSIINKKIRHQTAEEAIYLLYRQGLLDITEMETLLVNSENKYNPTFVPLVTKDTAEAGNNVIDFAKFAAQEKINE